MNIRRITSLTALLSFLTLITTSVVLYIVPQGRVAYWADWRLWGLTKTEWGNIHINLGLLFLISIGLHMKMPQTPPPGTGSRSLADLCQEYNLNIPIVVRGLAEENIKASAEMSLKEIATQNKRSPIDVYDAILKIAERS